MTLSIHKNTKTQRDAKNIRRELVSDAKNLAQLTNISGYSIVVWNSDCTALCSWKSSPPSLPGLVVPEFTKKALERQISQDDTNSIIDLRFNVND